MNLYTYLDMYLIHVLYLCMIGTNGTDSEFYNPKKKAEKEYLTFLAGFRQLAPKDVILNNLALSDVDLQDLIANADSVTSDEVKELVLIA